MKKVNILTLAAVGLLLVNLLMLIMMWNNHSASETGQGPPFEGGPPQGKGPHDKGRGPGDFIRRELHFDEAQQQQFEVLRLAHHDSLKVLRDQTNELKQQLFVFNEGIKNEENAQQVAVQIGDLQRKIELITYKHFAQVRALCTEEQKQKFDLIIKDVMRRLEPGPPGGGPPPPPRE